MNIDGQITRTDDNAFTGYIASLDFDVDITVRPTRTKRRCHLVLNCEIAAVLDRLGT